MEEYSIVIEKNAQKELQAHYRSGNKGTIRTIEKIFQELADHPKKGTGQPEALKFYLSGYWSRRINKKDRLIYRINEDIITVVAVAAIGHYSDK